MARLLLITLILSAYALPCAAQTNRALLVAIDIYPDDSGWYDIHATNDIRIIVPMLQRSGYMGQNIAVLMDGQATRAAVESELVRLATVSEPGDHIYVHFSCHGQQMLDDNGDEPDGLDEALIPYDARRRFTKGVYEGENHLRDDRLGELLDAIRAKTGPRGNVTLVVDACHSGTADRDADEDTYVRGTTYIFAPEGYQRPKPDPEKTMLSPRRGKELSPIAIFAACKPDQLNYEYREPTSGLYYGMLSLAFAVAVNTVDKNISTNDFQKELVRLISELNAGRRRAQTPYLETTDGKKQFRIGL